MLLNAPLFGAFYDFGNVIGPISATLCALLIVAALAYVMVKYLFSEDRRETRHEA